MLKKLVIVVTIGFCLMFFSAFRADSSNMIQVSGKGEVSFEPDIAYISLGVSGVFQDVSKGQKEINDKVNRFLENIKGIVIDKNISTERFSINHQYEYLTGKRQFVGYNIEQNLRIKLENLVLIGKIIDLAVASGLNNLGQIDFSSAKLDEYKQKALKLSLLDAKKKAEIMASTMDVNKIKLKRIMESNSFVQPANVAGLQNKALFAMDNSNNNTQYQVGEMRVDAQVNLIYEF